MEHIVGTYVKSLFFDAEKGHAAFFIMPRNAEDDSVENLIKVVGKFCLQQKGLPLFISGNWKDTEYGKEFHLNQIAVKAFSMETTEQYLLNLGVLISRPKLKRILKCTGENIFEKCMETDAVVEIAEKSGVDLMKVIEIFTKIKAMLCELELFKILDEVKGNYEQVNKIRRKYPDEALEIIKLNPYKLLEKVDIPFTVIDRIAIQNGKDPYAQERIQALLLWVLKKKTGAGNIYMTFEDLYKSLLRIIEDIPRDLVMKVLSDHPNIIRDYRWKDLYYEKTLYYDEIHAAKEFVRLMNTAVDLPFHEEYIAQIEKKEGYHLGEQQKAAFQLLTSTGIKLLTGDPGTGKTTTVNTLLQYLEMVWKEVYEEEPVMALCAPSGRAAQRMKETTGRNAMTIHKLIEYQPFGNMNYCKNAKDPIEADIIVVDEVSMLGLSTFMRLITAIRSGALVLMIGDVNQLQSVEPGNVLQDIINCGYVDRCHLTEVFRQGKESWINRNAKRIMQGVAELGIGNDFSYMKSKPNEMQALLVQTIQNMMQNAIDPDRIQILAPVRKGSCGVWKANEILQDIINPGKGGIYYGYRNLRVGDRIILLNNNYTYDYYNGDIGFIRSISSSNMTVEVNDREITIPRELYGDVDLAYACTIHKSQGTEFEHVIIVLQEDADGMLDQNLLYTAVTRGKKQVQILYENGTMEKAITTCRRKQRNSRLIERIEMEMQKSKAIVCIN